MVMIKTGKRAGETTEELFLKQPDFAEAMMRNLPQSWLAKEFAGLEATFDQKPILEKCRQCGERATRAFATHGSTDLAFRCGGCEPYDARSGKVSSIETFSKAMLHVAWTCDAPRKSKRE